MKHLLQVEMWERITVALAELGPAALAVSEEQRGAPSSGEASEPMTEEGLVQYEGMLISVAAAQRRRSGLEASVPDASACLQDGNLKTSHAFLSISCLIGCIPPQTD